MNDLPVTFNGDGMPHSATHEANRFIREKGWSVGPSSRFGVRAVMFGDYVVAKWHNLSEQDKAATHAFLVGRGRLGPLILTTERPQ